MDIFNLFSKDNEKKAQKGGNVPKLLNLKYKSEPTGNLDNLNSMLKKLNSDTKNINTYDDYFTNEANIFLNTIKKHKIFYQNELDYLYKQKLKSLKKETKPSNNDIEKMKLVGKIYTSNQTCMQMNDTGRKDLNISFNKLKVESCSNNFVSTFANNCVIKGKWCYEVTLLTGGLFQIGFCQLNTKITITEGVGDSKNSYGFDGFRKILWKGEKFFYGNYWDFGDVLGVCLDLDNRTIEYFLNGKSMGIGDKNILVGENVAYFPAASMSRGQACVFNFGQIPFKYEYKGYQSFDTPLSKINEIDSIISELLQIWLKNISPLIVSSKVSDYELLLLSYDILNFVSQYIDDMYIFNTTIIPFLIELKSGKTALPENNNYIFSKFILSILDVFLNHDTQKNIGYQIFELLSIEINQIAIRMGVFQNEGEKVFKNKLVYYENLMKVFISLLKCDKIASLLMEKGTLEIFKNVFNSNWFRLGELIDYLFSSNKYIATTKTPIKHIIKDLNKNYFAPKEKNNYFINQVISKQLSSLILLFLKDRRTLYDGKILKDEFNELIKHGYRLSNNDLLMDLFIAEERHNFQENIFIKNIFMNLVYMYTDNFLKTKFEEITTYPWFYRMNQTDIYFDEVGIGGTISHVTTEYGNLVPEELKVKNDEFSLDFFHKLIRISYDIFEKIVLKKYDEFYIKIKTSPICDYLNSLHESGTRKFNDTIKYYFYTFPLPVQIALYKFAFFLIKYLMYLVKKNAYIIYFIPTTVTEIPFSFFKLLINLKSRILYDNAFRQEINKSSPHFAEDDFIQNLVEFYLKLFADENIANPELKESLLKKVNFLLEKQIIEEFYDDDNKIFELLMKGLLKDLQITSLSHSASKILLKLITPICFGYKIFGKNKKIQKQRYVYNIKKVNNKEIFKDMVLDEKLKKYFEGNFNILEEFIKSYGVILNKVMTNYSMALSSIIEIGVARLDINNIEPNKYLINKHRQAESDRALYQGLCSSYNEMCQLLKIYEFLILTYPDEFLDSKKLNYTNFINVLKNISTRILSKPYIDHLIQLIKTINPKLNPKENSDKNKIEIYKIGLSIAGIFIQIHKWKKKNKFYDTFCKDTANTPDLNLEPFDSFMKLFLAELNNMQSKEDKKELIEDIEKNYSPMIEYLLSIRDVKQLTNDEMDNLISQDKLCILCYEYPSDTELMPCKHRCCQKCYEQYKIDKDTCFICHAKIESVNTINIK